MNENLSLLQKLKNIQLEQEQMKQRIFEGFAQGLQQMYSWKVQEEQKERQPFREDITLDEGIKTTKKFDVRGRPTYIKTEELEKKEPKERSQVKTIYDEKTKKREEIYYLKGIPHFAKNDKPLTAKDYEKYTFDKIDKGDNTKLTELTPEQEKLLDQVQTGEISRTEFLKNMLKLKVDYDDLITIAKYYLPEEKIKELTVKEQSKMQQKKDIIEEYELKDGKLYHNNKQLYQDEKTDAPMIKRYYNALDEYNGYRIQQEIFEAMKKPESKEVDEEFLKYKM